MHDASLQHRPPATDGPGLVWHSKKSDTLLNHGRTMTQTEAMAWAESGAANSYGFEVVTPTHFRYRTGFGTRAEYVGQYPMPEDTDRAMTALAGHLRGLGMNLVQRDLILSAVQAALDGTAVGDETAVALLKQVLATPLPKIG